MTAIAADRPGYRRWRHRAHLAVPWFYLLWVPLEWVTVPTWASRVWVVILLLAIAADLWHQRELCETCISYMPLDPQAAVARHMPLLRTLHFAGSRRGLWSLPLLLGVLALLNHFHWEVAHNVAASAVDLFFFWITLSSIRHRILYPWCPMCRHGGGGWDADENTPDPVGGKGRPVPSGT